MAGHLRLTAEKPVARYHKEGGRGVKSTFHRLVRLLIFRTKAKCMVFPISIGGTIRLKKIPNPDEAMNGIIGQIETLLDDALASTVTTNGTEISFTAGLFGRAVWNWNILLPFGSGRIWVERGGPSTVLVRYRFSTLQMLAIVSGMMALLALFLMAPQHDFKKGFSTAIYAVGIGWLWLFGMNYLIAMIRVPMWLRFGLRKSR